MPLNQHLITFEGKRDLEVYVLGALGRSTKSICNLTGLSHGQVEYRLRKAIEIERKISGRSNLEALRSGWRSGTSFTAKLVERQLFATIKNRGLRILPPAITHPTPRISPLRIAA
jgi:hypothetical protein